MTIEIKNYIDELTISDVPDGSKDNMCIIRITENQKYQANYYITKSNAIKIIAHLREQFKIE